MFTTNRFCEKHKLFLKYKIDEVTKKIYKHCTKCGEVPEEESKIISFTNKQKKEVNQSIIQSMIYDPHTYDRLDLEKKHENCDNTILKYYINNYGSYVFVCDKCGCYWYEQSK